MTAHDRSWQFVSCSFCVSARRNLFVLEQDLNRSASSIHSLSTSPRAVAVKQGLRNWLNSAPILWYRFRFKLIAFWEWKRQIVCCRKSTNERLRSSARRFSLTVDSMIRRRSVLSPISPTPRGRRESTWSEEMVSSCSSFTISTDDLVNVLVMFSTIFVILEIYGVEREIKWFADVILYLFLLEVVLKLIAFGRGYFDDSFNKLVRSLSTQRMSD